MDGFTKAEDIGVIYLFCAVKIAKSIRRLRSVDFISDLIHSFGAISTGTVTFILY